MTARTAHMRHTRGRGLSGFKDWGLGRRVWPIWTMIWRARPAVTSPNAAQNILCGLAGLIWPVPGCAREHLMIASLQALVALAVSVYFTVFLMAPFSITR